MKSFSAARLAIMAAILPTIFAEGGDRYLMAYTELNCEGAFQEFHDYVPDLSAYSLDNAIKSIYYSGTWILYTATNFVGWQGTFNGINYCFNLSSSSPVTSSLRYAGSPDGLNNGYYNLYEKSLFVGEEFKGDANATSVGPLDLDVSSLAINGESPWTFYTGLDYTGEAVCVYPKFHSVGEDGSEMTHYEAYSMSYVDMEDNSIRSVAKGCLSERIVRLPPSEASLRPEGDHKLTNSAH